MGLERNWVLVGPLREWGEGGWDLGVEVAEMKMEGKEMNCDYFLMKSVNEAHQKQDSIRGTVQLYVSHCSAACLKTSCLPYLFPSPFEPWADLNSKRLKSRNWSHSYWVSIIISFNTIFGDQSNEKLEMINCQVFFWQSFTAFIGHFKVKDASISAVVANFSIFW